MMKFSLLSLLFLFSASVFAAPVDKILYKPLAQGDRYEVEVNYQAPFRHYFTLRVTHQLVTDDDLHQSLSRSPDLATIANSGTTPIVLAPLGTWGIWWQSLQYFPVGLSAFKATFVVAEGLQTLGVHAYDKSGNFKGVGIVDLPQTLGETTGNENDGFSLIITRIPDEGCEQPLADAAKPL